MDYHALGGMLEAYYKLHPKIRNFKSITELKKALEVNWDSLPQEPSTRLSKASHVTMTGEMHKS